VLDHALLAGREALLDGHRRAPRRAPELVEAAVHRLRRLARPRASASSASSRPDASQDQARARRAHERGDARGEQTGGVEQNGDGVKRS
jgi:hypothetical protein